VFALVFGRDVQPAGRVSVGRALERRGVGMSEIPTLPNWLTIEGLSAEAGWSTYTTRRMIARGELKAYRFGRSRLIRIKRVDFERLAKPVTRAGALLGGDE